MSIIYIGVEDGDLMLINRIDDIIYYCFPKDVKMVMDDEWKMAGRAWHPLTIKFISVLLKENRDANLRLRKMESS